MARHSQQLAIKDYSRLDTVRQLLVAKFDPKGSAKTLILGIRKTTKSIVNFRHKIEKLRLYMFTAYHIITASETRIPALRKIKTSEGQFPDWPGTNLAKKAPPCNR